MSNSTNEEVMDYEDLDSTVVLCDEDGNEIEMEFLDLISYNEKEYVVLLPNPEAEEAEVVILEIASENGEDVYLGIEDDETVDAVFRIFKEKYKDILDFAE